MACALWVVAPGRGWPGSDWEFFYLEVGLALGIRGVGVVLAVGDVVESVRFYRDVVGFEVVSVEDDGDEVDFATLRMGALELMLTVADGVGCEGDGDESDEDVQRAGRDRSEIGFVFTCGDLDAAAAELRARGAEVEGPLVSDFGVNQAYLTDPDGYRSCFQAM